MARHRKPRRSPAAWLTATAASLGAGLIVAAIVIAGIAGFFVLLAVTILQHKGG